jgi:hypothetical protein
MQLTTVAGSLRRLVLTELSPPFDRLLITPEGERKKFPRLRKPISK